VESFQEKIINFIKLAYSIKNNSLIEKNLFNIKNQNYQSFLLCYPHGKTVLVVSKNLARYRSENNFGP